MADPTIGLTSTEPDITALMPRRRVVGMVAPQTGALEAAGLGALRGAIPAAGVIGGAELGAAAGSVIPGLGNVVGGIAGGLAGGIAGGYLGSKAQSVATGMLPASVTAPVEARMAAAEQEHPYASFAGGLAPFAATMNPLAASPKITRAVGAALQGGFEFGQEKWNGEPTDWTKVGLAAAFGTVFNRPNAIGERMRALMGGARTADAAQPAEVSNEALKQSTDQLLLPPPAIQAPPPLDTMAPEELLSRAQDARTRGDSGEVTRVAQEMMRRAGPTPPAGPEPVEGVIPQPSQDQVDLATLAARDRPVVTPGLTPDELEALPNPASAREEPEPPAPPPGPPPDERPVVTPSKIVADQRQKQAEIDYLRGTGHQVPPEPAAPALPAAEAEPVHPLADASSADLKTVTAKLGGRSLSERLDLSDFPKAQESIRAEIAKQTEDGQPPRANLVRVAKAYGVMDAEGREIPTPAQAVDEAHAKATEALKAVADLPSTGDPTIDAKVAAVKAASDTLAPVSEPTGPSKAATDIVAKLKAAQPKIVSPALAGASDIVANAPSVQSSLDTLKAMDVSKPGDSAKKAQSTNKIWQKGLAADPTGQSLWDDHLPKFNDAAQAALKAHTEIAQDAAEAQQAPLARPTPPPASAPRTQQDVDLTHVVGEPNATVRDALDYLRMNGSSAREKVVAETLLKHVGDTPIQFSGGDDLAALPRSSNLREGEPPLAMYDPNNGGRIHLFAGDDLEQSILHEATHAASYEALHAGGKAAKAFTSIYQEVLRRLTPEQHALDENPFRDPHEFMAEAFSNPSFRAWLRGQKEAASGMTLWQKFKNAISDLLGIKMPGQRNLLDQVMEHGERVMGENARAIRTPLDVEAAAQPLFRLSDKLKAVSDTMLDAHAAKGWADGISGGVLKVSLGWSTDRRIADWFGKSSVGLKANVAERDRRDLLNETNNKVGAVAVHMLKGLNDKDLKIAKDMVQGTYLHMDGRALLSEAQLAEIGKLPNSKELIQKHNDMMRGWKNMSEDGKAAYNAAVATNRSHIHQLYTTQLYNMLKGDKSVTLPEDPSEAHRMQPDLHDSPSLTEKFWADRYDALRKIGQGKVDDVAKQVIALKPTKDTLPPDVSKASAKIKALNESVAPLKSLLNDRDSRVKEMDAVPSFKMGHGEGGFYVAGKLAVGEDKLAPAAGVDRFQKALDDAGFSGVTLDRNHGNNTVYARVDSRGDMATLRDIFQKMHDSGVLEKDSISNGSAEEVITRQGILPLWQEKALETMRAHLNDLGEDAPESVRDAIRQRVAETTREFMAMLPDSSAKKIMATRKGAQGYSDDILQNFKQRSAASARMLANMAAMPRIAESVVQMRKDVTTMNKDQTATDSQKLALHAAVQELALREAQRTMAQPSSFIAGMREFTHVVEIGTSPAYVLMLASQIGTLSLPRLGATHGYLNSASALGRATATTMKIMRTALEGTEGSSFGLRQKELLAAGVPPRMTDFIMKMSAMGAFTHASYTTAMRGSHADATTPFQKARNWASSMGLYAEMLPRVLTAIAAKDLYERNPGRVKTSVEDHALDMVRRSQLDWNPTFNPRQVTKGGSFGPMSPLINQFMGYQIRLTELMHRDLAASFGREGPEAARESRAFLAGHLAAITTIAGTLGMPMAGVFASVFDRLADWATNKDDWDITAQYRKWLGMTFTPTVGEAIAKGAPRAFGVDLSRLGDEKMLPGSTAALYLTEKRKLEDAEKDWLKAEAGSAAGLIANAAFGIRDISNGDYLRGAQKLVPEILRGPVEATQIATRGGYFTKSGMKLPITAGAAQVLMTAAGLDPESEAQFNDKQKVVSGEQNLAQLRSANIMNHLSQALTRNDQPDFQKWVGESNQFSRDHPGQPPPIANLARFMEEHYRNAAIAEASGGPAPLSLRNLTARGMISGW